MVFFGDIQKFVGGKWRVVCGKVQFGVHRFFRSVKDDGREVGVK